VRDLSLVYSWLETPHKLPFCHAMYSLGSTVSWLRQLI